MITRDELLPLLVKACPSFSDEYEKNLSDKSESYWFDEGQLLPYTALGDFSRHIVHLYKVNQTSEFKDIFSLIELLHIEGDAYVREAATIGILEGIQNIASNSEMDPNVFGPRFSDGKPMTEVHFNMMIKVIKHGDEKEFTQFCETGTFPPIQFLCCN